MFQPRETGRNRSPSPHTFLRDAQKVVYVLVQGYNGENIVGVFTTREKAREYIRYKTNKHGPMEYDIRQAYVNPKIPDLLGMSAVDVIYGVDGVNDDEMPQLEY